MKKTAPWVWVFLFPMLLRAQTPAAELDSIWSEYIRKYKDIAMDEMERSGIPASIKLAQGILESRAGTSELAVNASNHFGIKCGKGWRGKSYHKDDDERNKKGERVHSCFRKYDNVVECFADHSEFIRNPEKRHRYGFLFELDPRDYKGWAQGLEDAGYSAVDYYAEKLIFFIERYHLNEYDALAFNGRLALKRLAQVNDVKMVQARENETIREIAGLYNLPVEKLIEYNDGGYTADEPLSVGTWVYMQTKRDKWQGPAVFHTVDSGQNLFAIAQLYGLTLASLQRRNGLTPEAAPAEGELIRLKGKRANGEQLRLTDATLALPVAPDEAPNENKDDLATGAFTIEMLPEERLDMPVFFYDLNNPDTARPATADPALLLADEADPTPTIILGSESGKTEIYYTVSKGDTLYSIARRYSVSTSRLRQLNRMKDNVVKIGQRLRVN